MKVRETQRISIVGAGLAGTLLAIKLARRGFRVDLFERFADQRRQPIPAGRSINLALAERGRYPLDQVGLLDTVDTFTVPMRGRLLHDPDGKQVLQPYGKDDSEVIYSVHRARLNVCLLDAAEATGRIRLYFRHKLIGIDFDARRALFEDERNGQQHHHPFEVLIGADGGGSRVRQAMIDGANLGLREELLDHGYKELTIPADTKSNFLMDPNALHIWPRGGYMMIALPNADGSFTVTLFLAKRGEPGFDQLPDWPKQRYFIRTEFPDAYELLADLERDFRENPVGLLGTIRCDRWQIDGKVLLIGDAAHAIVPFHGQGMNAAFEDCKVLTELLDQCDEQSDWQTVFQRFESQRRPDVEAIADMALENYRVMRDAVRDPKFLLRKALEHELERRHPERFIARYSQVMFHRIPYAEALARGKDQARLLDQLLERAEQMDQIDFDRARQLIDDSLAPFDPAHFD